MTEERHGIWSNTASGRQAYITDPLESDVDIEDIALSLAKTCRFGGHVRRDVWHYSVAQHCVLVSYACKPEHALIGLLHDASEAYVGDIVRPVKEALGEAVRVLEWRWHYAIGRRFGLDTALVHQPDDVKWADEAVLATERRDLVEHRDRPWQLRAEPLPERIEPWAAQHAYNQFMGRFGELVRGDSAYCARSVVP